MPLPITELHNIMPLANLASVLEHGILSHYHASQLPHHDVSMPIIQERRDIIVVPRGLPLHHYASLYFHARNPMLYVRQNQAHELGILRISVDVLKIKGAVITDQNASSQYVRFLPPSALNQLDLEQIYAEDWRHPENQIAHWRHKSQKCAEVLIPHLIPPSYILGIYVVSPAIQQKLQNSQCPLPITVYPHLFFRSAL